MHQDSQTLARIQQASARALNTDMNGVEVIYMLEKIGVRVTAFSTSHRISKIVPWLDIEQMHIDPLLYAHNEVVKVVTEAMTNADS